jgi:hypothetical protein
MKWSQIRKRLKVFLADCVSDRVTFGTTSYRKSHDQIGRGWIAIDGIQILNMPSLDFEIEAYGRRRNPEATYEEMSKEVHELNLFSQWDLQKSLYQCINLPIDEILTSENPLVRAVGMLDARLGKRRLAKLDVSAEHDLVKRFYALRISAEKMVIRVRQSEDLTTELEPRWKDTPARPVENTRQEPQLILSRSNKSNKIRSLITKVYRNEISKAELVTAQAKAIFDGFRDSGDPETLYRLFQVVESRSKLLTSTEYIRGIIELSIDAGGWLRPIEDWRPDTHNAVRQFSSLARHLWAHYDVPIFLDKAWLSEDRTQQKWFKVIGSGKNIRTAPDLPITLTRNMAHFFLLAPDAYSVEAALRWAQVCALGGDRRLADALQETKIARDFRDEDFWLGVIRFFVRNPMLDPIQISPIIDYIWNQKYEDRIVFTGPGVAEQIGPEQPNFSMKGRTAISLLKAVDAWHKHLGRDRKGGNLQWSSSGILPLNFVEGTKRENNMKLWRIRELLSSGELITEGRMMQHCVASYATSCNSGTCSIWTMEVQEADIPEKLLTIEVGTHTRQIRQIRGKRNRLPTEKEKEIVRRWAEKEHLELASYIQ